MKYSIGLDFGTLSGRAVLCEVETGNIIAQAAIDYPHGVIDESLFDKNLPPDWALQHPQDYLDVLYYIVPEVMKKAHINKEDVIGIGVDFTSCTIVPLNDSYEPLCFDPAWREEPHAYVKLWKHHAAQRDADRLREVAQQRNESWLERYGGRISSEFLFPKLMQILREAPDVYEAASTFMECGDWLVFMLCGAERRSACAAGYKALWSKSEGYPSNEFFAALDPRMENVVDEKLSRDIYPLGQRAGYLTAQMAERLGLHENTAVAVNVLDAHVALPAVGITKPGEMLMIIGTSACDMMLSDEEKPVKGICGYVDGGILPGYFGYEAGQACVGDHFDWLIRNIIPSSYQSQAEEQGISIHTLLEQRASQLKVGESGLLALDWWNGNRSVLVDADLTGLLIGMNLNTKPEEIYRALIEGIAFGLRKIIEAFIDSGIGINTLYACGGIADKNKLMMQIYADVTGKDIYISGEPQTVALGSAIFGAVAAGKTAGGYDDVFEAANMMSKLQADYYRANESNKMIYDKLFSEYEKLHDYFGRGGNDVMKRLKSIKTNAMGQ
jgi:L-ribulokinase